ncbi:NAD(+) diphosphatase [Oceanomicrobium pacificus]|uniref:NAD(+) diphosphatase n=1 Tax=Oceanomicrobium pacificus TaxID=2692916 RepID=A0A6B0TNN8_9RHOB|nr:NAD(+) diphosphatase [Oceanomicrobium pacificus]MXU64199.1 NAD(+) diphosphatase [Oceanomicrobium pacificus]
MRDAELVTFGGSDLDRCAELREDEATLANLARDPAARALPVWRLKPLFDLDSPAPRLGWMEMSAPVLAESETAPIFLGCIDGAPRFAVDVSPWVADEDPGQGFIDGSRHWHPSLPEDWRFVDLRAIMGELTPQDAGNAAAARGIFGWHDTHRFCARCGQPSVPSLGGWRRTCTDCGSFHFPRTDPVVIMLVTRGDRLLLGRSPAWPDGMYSLLAGFMEPGETIEAAVRREVWEEAGITVGPVRYLASQPWPFPASLMIGCHGLAETEAITLDPKELEDARWVDKDEVLRALDGRHPDLLPARKGAIARFLIEAWLGDRLDD